MFGSGFGSNNKPPAINTGFGFGGTSTSGGTSAPGLSINTAAPTGFGQPAAPTAPTAPTFGTFGGQPSSSSSTSMGGFGTSTAAPAPTATSTGFPTINTGFGTPASQSTSLFGQSTQPAVAAPAQSTSLFAAPAQTTSSTFGTPSQTTSTFGSTSQTPSLFGQTTSTAAPSNFNFGASTAAPAAGTSMFGASAAPSTFGASMTAAAPMSLFSSQQQNQPSASIFAGQQQFQQSAQQQAVPQGSSVAQDFENLMSAFDPNDQRCRFRHPFYNLVAAEDAPKYTKPPHISDGLWNDAKSASPDPSCLIPVFASGFGDLKKRIEHQNHQALSHNAKLDEVQTELEKIQQKQQIDINGRLLKCQREHIRLSQKVLKIMQMVQLLRSRGHTNLTREEEELRARFEGLLSQLQQPAFQSRVDQMMTEVQAIKNAQKTMAEKPARPLAFEVLDEPTVQNMFKVLSELQHGLQQVTHVLQNDIHSSQVIAKGYQRPPNETTNNGSATHWATSSVGLR